MKVRGLVASTVAVLALSGLSACAASDDEASTDTGSNSSSENCVSGTGVTDTSIKFGASMALSGAAATAGQEQKTAAEAFVKMVNDDGGINGRKLELIVQDSVSDPQKDVTNVQYLIEQEKVFAIWGIYGSANAVAVAPITTAAGVPLLFPYGLSTPLDEQVRPHVFSVVTTNSIQAEAIGTYMAENAPFKGKKMAIMAIATPDGEESTKGFKDSPMGKNVVAELDYERGATSFKAQLLTAKDAGAQIFWAGVADAQFAKVLSEAQELGIQPGKDMIFFPSISGVTTNVFTLAPGLVDGSWGAPVFAAPGADVPGMDELTKVVKAYDASAPIGTPATVSWVGGLVIREALENAGDCVNADSISAEIEKLKDFDTGGLTVPLTFSEDDHLGNQSVQMVEAKNGEWIPVGDWISG